MYFGAIALLKLKVFPAKRKTRSHYWYFCLSWLPSFFVMDRGFAFLKIGEFTALPLLGMAVVSVISGRIADRMSARMKRPFLVRKLFIVFGFVLGSLILALPLQKSPFAVLTVATMSLLEIGIASANYWTITQLLSPPWLIGRVVGCQNMVANLAGICASLITGLLVSRLNNVDLAITVAGLSLLIAALLLHLLLSLFARKMLID